MPSCVTHSGFEKTPVSRATQEEFLQGQLRELALAIEQQRKDGDSRIVKALERAKKRLEAKFKEFEADGSGYPELVSLRQAGVDTARLQMPAHLPRTCRALPRSALRLWSESRWI